MTPCFKLVSCSTHSCPATIQSSKSFALAGRHQLLEASLQTVVNQCVNYNKDPFLGPVSKNSKVARTPSANVIGSGPSDGNNVYEALASKSFNYHFGCCKKALAESKGTCMFCHDTAHNSDHKTRDCLILKKLGLKLEKRLELVSNIDAFEGHGTTSGGAPQTRGGNPSPLLQYRLWLGFSSGWILSSNRARLVKFRG